LKPGGWCDKGSWVDCRHPDPSLVDFEKVRYQGIEVDIGVSEIVKGQLLPVPGDS
jgi:hypothetical protein